MQTKASRQALKIALIYVIAAGAWILFSDELVKRLVHDPDTRTTISIFKGWGFVLLTGGLLHLTLLRLLGRWARQVEQRRQAEAAARSAMEKLRQQEQQLRLVAEASADGIWDWNLTTGLAELSPRYWEIIGYAPGESVANREFFQQLVHPEDWPGVLAAMTDHLAGKTADSKIEYRMITKEGIEKWVWGRGKVVERAADGSPLRMVGTISDITLQKMSELLLIKSEQRYRSLFENMNEGFALCRMIFEDGQPKDFVYLAVNQMFTTLTGLQEVVGKRVTEIIPGVREQDPELFDLYARVVRTGTPEKTERLLKSLQMWFSLAVYSTEPESFVVVFDVITERKRAEAALQLSDFSVNQSSLPTFWVASNARIVRANRAASALLGFAETELLQLAVTDLDPNVPAARWPADWQELRAQKHKHFETQHRHKDGHLIPVEVDLNWFEFGGQEYNFVFVRDITEQKRAKAARHENESLLRSILENSREVIFVKDRECRFVFMNPAGYRLTGLTPEKLLGRSKVDFHPNPAEVERFMADDRRVMESGQTETIEEEISAADGGKHIFLTSKVARLDSRGQVIGMIGVAHDITERKRGEQDIQRLAAFARHNPNPVLELSAAGEIIYFNAAAMQMVGALGQKHLAGMLPPNTAAIVHDCLAKARPLLRLETQILNRTISWSFFPVETSQSVHCYAGDITERKQAEKTLRESEEKFSRMFQSSPVVMTLTDLEDGRYLDVNEAFLLLLGKPREEVVGQRSLDLGIWADAEQRAAVVARLKTHGSARNVILQIRAASGQIRQVLWSGERVVIGETVCMLSSGLDITERKLAEDALRESEKRYRQLFELESDALILADSETHRFVDVNQSAQRLYGYSREEFLQMKLEDVSAEPERNRLSLEGGSSHIPLRRHRRKNGERFAVEITINEINYQGRRILLAAVRDITDRQQVMDMLGETTEQLLEAQHIAGLGSYVFDVRSGTWTGSEVLDELFGIVDSSFIRDMAGWLQIVHPQERAEMRRYLDEEVLKNHAAFDRTYRIIRLNDREERWVHGLGKLTLDDHGQVVRMVGVIQDITERKRAERALLESQALYSSLVMQLPIGIFRKDEQGRFVLVNPGFCQLKGLKPEDFLGKTPREVIGGETAKQHTTGWAAKYFADGEDHHRQIMRTGLPLELDEEYMLANGEKQFVHVMKFPVLSVDGKIIGTQGVQFDITERKRAEEQAHLQFSALKAAANAIVITDRQGKIVWVNPAFTKLTGYTEAEAVGSNPRLLKSGEHPPSFYANMWATILTGNPWHGELVNRHKDGRLYTESLTITPVRNDAGKITHFVAIKEDVSERRQLENRVQQAQKMEAIGTLAGGIAHDFNNILAAIFGYGNLLQQDTEGNSAAQEDIGEILKAAGRAKELVQQILTFSRQREQKRQVIRLDSIVKEATKFLRASLPAQIKIEMNLAEDAPAVLADPTQIYQVTMNLATNALHAMDGQPGRLTVALDSFQPDKKFIQGHAEFRAIQYTRLTVADTGQGMDAKTLARIFEPFFTTKPVGKGTGLGLAVVHGIVRSHDGAITVESQPGQGTTFRLYFPAQTPTDALAEAAAAKLPGGHGQKILLVDDEPALTATFQRLLARLNYQVTSCNSARDALALFHENPAQFDLVITDLTMPEMNGLELARQLRTLHPELPVLLASGFNPDLSRESLTAAGICELLEKPIAMTALTDALQRTLGK